MQITPIDEMLAPADLGVPLLRVLIPNEDNYSVLLLQPKGLIDADATGVHHVDSVSAAKQFCGFLDEAQRTKADLAVTPEYSMPWATLLGALKAGHKPEKGALWVLGCESIKYGDLAAIKLDIAPQATLLYEPLTADPKRFVDPLAYVFVAPAAMGTGPDNLVVLVQFKTCPMGDNGHFEINGMQRGTHIYQFGGGANSLRLVTLICSDALDFLDQQATAVYDRTLVLHIQLNPKPRQEQFKQYRSRLMRFAGDLTEIICLNWAQDVFQGGGKHSKCWNNISGSAWYLRPDKFDDGDQTLTVNHKRGLYYTWLLALRSHALFFNYQPATYLLTATKVAHIGVSASLSRRRGPQLIETRSWDEAMSSWVVHATPEDGFASIVAECGNAQSQIKSIADINPFNAERVLALCAGNIGPSQDWYALRSLDSFGIESSEVIRRITVCQDPDPDARAFRIARLKRCGRLWEILTAQAGLPAALADLTAGFHLEWNPNYAHQNVLSSAGKRSTVIYMGEDASASQIETVLKRVAEYLHRASGSPDNSIEARQRLHVWFRNDTDQIELFDAARYLKYDDPRSTSEFDIARAE